MALFSSRFRLLEAAPQPEVGGGVPSRRPVLALAGIAGLAGLLVLSACRPSGDSPPTKAAQAAEGRHPLTGTILSVAHDRKRLIVRHDEIPGYMPAMTMEFQASDGDLANAREGQAIRAELVEVKDGDFRLEKIWPADPESSVKMNAGTQALVQDTTIRGRNAYREVGENAPEFTLYNQNGEVVHAARFRGKYVMINFIFTRCPVATMCPAAVARFQQVQARAKESGIERLELLSISLDPAYDTPGVLREYATARGIDTGNYSFLTGPEVAIKSLLAQFGVLAEFKGDLLNHTLATVLIDPSGRIVWRADGSMWSVDEFVERMKR